MSTSLISYNDAVALAGGTFGVTDTPCPICGPGRRSPVNRKRKVLRIWYDEPGFATFYCARCDARGYARDDHAKTVSPGRIKKLQREASQRELGQKQRQLEKARYLWARREPIDGSFAETYLRSARGISVEISSLAFLPPFRAEYHPALIAAFGIADEPEPGALLISDEQVRGVHLTLLNSDGSGKAGTSRDKLMVGPSNGWPIVIAPMADSLSLYICEGIETGLSLHEATGCGVWAAGAAGRLPALADKVPVYTDCITVVGELDAAGRNGAIELAERLTAHGLCCELCFLGEEAAA